MKFLAVFLCDFCLFMVISSAYFHCPENEISDNCKKPCQPTCQSPYIPSCNSLHCQPGCVCRPGTIRDEASGRCISLQYCPRACSRNEVQNNGRNGCERTCQNQHLGFHCVIQNKRCVCKPGLLRDLHSGKCVPQEHCPKVQCELNEEWSLCTNPLSRGSCQDRFKNSMPQPSTCIPACECKKGFIWDEYSKRCIPEYECPKACGENQEWRKCSNAAWEETCQRRKSKVNTTMCMAGCSCKDGYLWDEHYNQCVPREHCSKVCRKNEEWCRSISNNVATCQNILKPQCRKYVVPSFHVIKSGCICKEGFIWNEAVEKCVLLKNCPNIFTTTTSTINTVTSSYSPTTVTRYTTEVPNSITSTTANSNTVSSSIPTSPVTATETSAANTLTGSTPTTSTVDTGTVTIIKYPTTNTPPTTASSNFVGTTASLNTNTATTHSSSTYPTNDII